MPFLHLVRNRLAEWMSLPSEALRHAVIAQYRPGTELGWHRDVPEFEHVLGLSLEGTARMRFRPYPPHGNRRATSLLELEPRSAYAIIGEARWGWQHAISPTKALRYSITFRTLQSSSR